MDKEKAAVRIQCWWRGVCYRRKRAAEYRLNNILIPAALTIQCAYRQYVARKIIAPRIFARKRAEAILTLQRAFRCALARRKVAPLIRTRLEKAAALTIQRVWRGHKGRVVGRVYRERVMQLRAAILIQKHLRRLLAVNLRRIRRRIKMKGKAPVLIQRMWRGHLCRTRYRHWTGAMSILNASATKIQKVWRGHFYRTYLHADVKHWLQMQALRSDRIRLAIALRQQMERKMGWYVGHAQDLANSLRLRRSAEYDKLKPGYREPHFASHGSTLTREMLRDAAGGVEGEGDRAVTASAVSSEVSNEVEAEIKQWLAETGDCIGVMEYIAKLIRERAAHPGRSGKLGATGAGAGGFPNPSAAFDKKIKTHRYRRAVRTAVSIGDSSPTLLDKKAKVSLDTPSGPNAFDIMSGISASSGLRFGGNRGLKGTTPNSARDRPTSPEFPTDRGPLSLMLSHDPTLKSQIARRLARKQSPFHPCIEPIHFLDDDPRQYTRNSKRAATTYCEPLIQKVSQPLPLYRLVGTKKPGTRSSTVSSGMFPPPPSAASPYQSRFLPSIRVNGSIATTPSTATSTQAYAGLGGTGGFRATAGGGRTAQSPSSVLSQCIGYIDQDTQCEHLSRSGARIQHTFASLSRLRNMQPVYIATPNASAPFQ